MRHQNCACEPILHGEAPHLGGAVVTIGAFDGVHLGHQALIRRACEAATRLGVPSVAWTFDPPPKAFFGEAPRLTTAHEKIRRIAALGVDHLVLSHFDSAFRARSAESFIEELARMNPIEVWVGDDFRFGAMQAGDVEMLRRHFPVGLLAPVHCPNGVRVSSSRIRDLWKNGRYDLCKSLLGWPDQFIFQEYEEAW